MHSIWPLNTVFFGLWDALPPQIWEENGGASYNPNIAYIYIGEILCYLLLNILLHFLLQNFFSYFPPLKPRCVLWSEKYGKCLCSLPTQRGILRQRFLQAAKKVEGWCKPLETFNFLAIPVKCLYFQIRKYLKFMAFSKHANWSQALLHMWHS